MMQPLDTGGNRRSGARRAIGCCALAVAAMSVACEASPMSGPTKARAADAKVARQPATPDLADMPLSSLRSLLGSGQLTSERLVAAYLERIAAIDRRGPRLGSVIAVDPTAISQARRSDEERAAGRSRGPLHGIPILLKDNIEADGPLPTTAGSLALVRNVVRRDAPLVASLREAGAIILGKTNLSEWANIRSSRSTSGWSAVGGLVRNPHALDRNACGSSSGSGAAAAAGLAAATVGTETNGSITCPASVNGVVGLKPTVGLVSQVGIVPISRSQDTAGPMARTVEDAGLLLSGMLRSASQTPAEATRKRAAVTFDLERARLAGVRIGVLRWAVGSNPRVKELYDRALANLSAGGARLVEIEKPDGIDGLGPDEMVILMTELKAGLNEYLAGAASAVKTRSLKEVIAFNKAQADREMRWFGQDLLERAEGTLGLADPTYLAALRRARAAAGPLGIDRMMKTSHVEALVAPTAGPAWVTDLVNGDHVGSAGIGGLAAIAGYPHLTVPMGDIEGLPVGLSFVGGAWSDGRLLEIGHEFEKRTARRRPPRFDRSAVDPDVTAGGAGSDR